MKKKKKEGMYIAIHAIHILLDSIYFKMFLALL